MFKKVIPLLVMYISLLPELQAQTLASLRLPVPEAGYGMSRPVWTDLDQITDLPAEELSLWLMGKDGSKEIPFQLEDRGGRKMYWMIDPQEVNGQELRFELLRRAGSDFTPAVRLQQKNGVLQLLNRGAEMLGYQFSTAYPPQGVDTVFKRSGFIHPLRTPAGDVLTRVNAPDHYHHFGLWNPWTRIGYEGKVYDLWNLGDRQGTVRFAHFISEVSGPVFGAFQALHEHVIFRQGSQKNILNELQTLRMYPLDEQAGAYMIDLHIKLSCATSSPVTLQAYRYGGLGWRATERWNRENSSVLTSQGKSKVEADGTNARWVLVQGDLDSGQGGMMMLSGRTNYNHPEPLRVWPEDANERGDVFVNFSPTKDKDWELLPGKEYNLHYRLIVFDGNFDAQRAEAAWRDFARVPPVEVKVLDRTN